MLDGALELLWQGQHRLAPRHPPHPPSSGSIASFCHRPM